jgi:hypothetical protein
MFVEAVYGADCSGAKKPLEGGGGVWDVGWIGVMKGAGDVGVDWNPDGVRDDPDGVIVGCSLGWKVGFTGGLENVFGNCFFPRTRASKSSVVSSIGPTDELSCIGDTDPLAVLVAEPSSCNFCVCCWITFFSNSRMTANKRLN